jgi:hypothetical protein
VANTYLTPDWILRKALQVLHAKLNFIGSINREYDDSFRQGGAAIGNALRIRLPEKFTVTTGRIMQVQDQTEQSETMTVATQKHVALRVNAADRALKEDDFVERKIVPAMSVLASDVERDALNMVLDIPSMVGTYGTPPTDLTNFGLARARMNQNLAPQDGRRMALIDSLTGAGMAQGQVAYFHDQEAVKKLYREGLMGRAAGFTFAENDLLPVLTVGSRAGTITVDGAAPTGATLALKALTGATDTVKAGEVFTIAGYYAVHDETKTPFTFLKQFVVTEDAVGISNAIAELKFSPSIVTSGAYQNVYGTPGTDAGLTFLGTASRSYGQNICFHKNAFAFVSADLPYMPGGECSRKVMDSISMRYWSDGDIRNDEALTRIDVLYGYKTIRQELACRVIGQGTNS